MKKIIICIFGVLSTLTAHAQLEVDSIGSVILTPYLQNTKNMVKIGTTSNLATYYDHANLYSAVIAQTYGFNVAVVGDALDYSKGSQTRNVGLLGITGNSGSGYSYGVWGTITNGRGAGIYGSVGGNANNLPIYGTYAGYFDGPTYFNGYLDLHGAASIRGNINHYGTFNSISDKNFKTNIEEIGEKAGYGVLKDIKEINIYKYNLDTKALYERMGHKTEDIKADEKIHFGVIAQELQTIYPNLINEDEYGTLTVNYIELIPLLIQSIKELNDEIDQIAKITGYERGIAKAKSNINSVNDITAPTNILYQNTPNPFKESTTIRFHLSDDVKDASICIFDMQGKMLKKYNVSTNDEQLTINAFELGEGMFLYTLIADGKEIDTKRMILTK